MVGEEQVLLLPWWLLPNGGKRALCRYAVSTVTIIPIPISPLLSATCGRYQNGF